MIKENTLLPHEELIAEQIIGMSELTMEGAALILESMDKVLKANQQTNPGYRFMTRSLEDIAEEFRMHKDESSYGDDEEGVVYHNYDLFGFEEPLQY